MKNAQFARGWTAWNYGSQPKSKKKRAINNKVWNIAIPKKHTVNVLGTPGADPQNSHSTPAQKFVCSAHGHTRGGREGGVGPFGRMCPWKIMRKKVKQQDLGEKRKRKEKNTWNEMKKINEKRQRENKLRKVRQKVFWTNLKKKFRLVPSYLTAARFHWIANHCRFEVRKANGERRAQWLPARALWYTA